MRVVEGVATVDDLDAFLDRLTAVGDEHGCTVQAFDARYVVGREHLERAVDLADRAIERGENIARDRAVEILLYVAGRRQINRALTVGVDADGGPVVILVDSPADDEAAEERAATAVADLDAIDPADPESGAEAGAGTGTGTGTLGAYDPERVRAFYDVSEAELEAVDGDLADLVCERVALLVVEK